MRSEPVDDERCDVATIRLVEDLVARAGVDLQRDIGNPGITVALPQHTDEPTVAGQRVILAGDHENGQLVTNPHRAPPDQRCALPPRTAA